MRRTQLSGTAVLLGAALVAGPAHAYVRSTTKMLVPTAWNDPSINLLLYVGDPPDYLDRATIVKAVHAAAAAWSKPATACTDVQLNVSEVEESFITAAVDKVNRIGFRRGQWRKMPCDETKELCSPYASAAIAITTVTSATRTGEIIDADMEINTIDKKFVDVVTDGDGHLGNDVHDLQNTVTHEFGHLIGLDHTCYNFLIPDKPIPKDNHGVDSPSCNMSLPPEIKNATMFAQAVVRETEKRSLEADDLLAVCEIYPVGYKGQRTMEEENPQGCAMGGPGRRAGTDAGASWALLGLGLGIALGLRGRRRL